MPRNLHFFIVLIHHFHILFFGQNNPEAIGDVLLSHVTQTTSGAVRVPVNSVAGWWTPVLDVDTQGIAGLNDR